MDFHPDIAKVMKKYEVPEPSYLSVDRLPSGSFSLDRSTGGGWAVERVNLMYGPKSSGKTTTAIITAINTIRNGGKVAYFDAEVGYNPDWGRKLGVDESCFLLVQGGHGEWVTQRIRDFVKEKAFDLIILDSIEALRTKAELEGEMEDNIIGRRAMMNNKFFALMAKELVFSKTTLLCINQVRQGRFGEMYADHNVLPGGEGQSFYATIAIEFLSPKRLQQGDKIIGTKQRGKTTKNRTAPFPQQFEFDVRQWPMYGVDAIPELVTIAKDYGILKNKEGEPYKSGHAFFEGTFLGGKESDIIQFLYDHDSVATGVEAAVRGEMAARLKG